MVTVFGLVFFGLAGLVLVGRIVYPNVIPNEILPLALVLSVMGAIGGFPEQYMQLLNPRLRNITNELQSHLSQIGVDSYIIDLKGPEAIRHSDKLWLPTGAVRIRDRNIDLVELKVRLIPDEGTAVQYVCAIRGEVRDEDTLQAQTDGGGIWSGGKLANALNSDNELRTMQTRMISLPITVRGIKSDSYVAIHKKGLGPAVLDEWAPSYGMGDYPSADEFRAFDRIAGHVKEVLLQEEQLNKNAEEERKREEEQASRMLTASIPALLERRGGLSSKEIGDELRVAAPGLQNLQVVQVLLRLTEEGTLSRTRGEDMILRYSRKT